MGVDWKLQLHGWVSKHRVSHIRHYEVGRDHLGEGLLIRDDITQVRVCL